MTSAVKSEQSNRSVLVQFILIYFFIHIVIYSSHNYRETLAKEVFKISSQDYSFIEMISVIKLAGSITSTYISQRYVRPLVVTFIATSIFILSLVVLINNVIENKYANLLLGCLHIVADSAILPTIDAECLTLLNNRGISQKFSKIRVFSTIGHSITYLINMFIQRTFQDTKMGRSILISTLSFGIVTIACLANTLFTISYTSEKEDSKMVHSDDKVQSKSKISQKSFKSENENAFEKVLSTFKLFRVDYVIILAAAVGSGISRSSLQSYLSEYLRNTRASSDEGYIYFTRTLCELFVWSVVIWLGDRVSLEALFPVAIGLGAVRALFYSISPSNEIIRWILPYIAEMFKSAYSALFIYVCTKLAHKYAGSNQKTLSQGVFTGFYSGLSPFLAGLLSYHVFSVSKNSDFQDKEKLFRIAGCIGLGATALSFVLYLRSIRNRKVAI
ncbi:hypothetical protein NEMIN01_1412 [Nematocida minor]|uniref:uncharacterized protein n=1 Tax=Nematocida minor TaxID=1912983 RepID=UPI002220160A|nr:uncharacterized protein NEMIN01_1412 [Nematocida minor]KAI5191204.1 hypothetical protein NEMIN01_1412 [Nematocida minor]